MEFKHILTGTMLFCLSVSGPVQAVEIDDFEDYANTTALRSVWGGAPVSLYPNPTLSSSAAVGSNAMSIAYDRTVSAPIAVRKTLPPPRTGVTHKASVYEQGDR